MDFSVVALLRNDGWVISTEGRNPVNEKWISRSLHSLEMTDGWISQSLRSFEMTDGRIVDFSVVALLRNDKRESFRP